MSNILILCKHLHKVFERLLECNITGTSMMYDNKLFALMLLMSESNVSLGSNYVILLLAY